MNSTPARWSLFGRPDPDRLSEKHRRRLTLFAMCLSQGMILLDVTIVNIALPSIQRELHMTPGRLEWVISAYALTLATLIPLGGTLGDRFGRKRLFILGMVVFTIASAGCALSTIDLQLIGFRVLQGIGGAVLSALTLSIISETYPVEERAGAIGIWASIAGLGFGAGPIVGGLLLGVFSWSSIFWVNVPIGMVGLAVAATSVKESKDPRARRIDVVGVTLSVVGLFLLTFGLVESSSSSWGSPTVLGSLLAGVVLLGCFGFWEHHTTSPMMPPRLLRERSFGTSCGVYFLAYLSLTGFMFYATLLFQDVKGWSAFRTGLSWLCMNVPFLLTAQFSGRLHRRFSSASIITTGCLVSAAGTIIMSQVTTTTPFALAAASYVCIGVGFATLVPAVTNAAMSDVPEGNSGVASGILNASRQVGTSVGLAVLGTIGVHASLSAWGANIHSLPTSAQGTARSLGETVAGGQISTVVKQLGTGARDVAVSSFLRGFERANIVAGAALIVGALLALLGLRHLMIRHKTGAQPAGAEPTEAVSRSGIPTGVAPAAPLKSAFSQGGSGAAVSTVPASEPFEAGSPERDLSKPDRQFE